MSILDFFTKGKQISDVKQLEVNEISDLFKKKDKSYIFIDVREPNEWEQGVIPGITKISIGNIEKHFSELNKDRNYIIVCRSGNRSGKVAEKMAQAGYGNVINFKGGMLDWYANKLPVE